MIIKNMQSFYHKVQKYKCQNIWFINKTFLTYKYAVLKNEIKIRKPSKRSKVILCCIQCSWSSWVTVSIRWSSSWWAGRSWRCPRTTEITSSGTCTTRCQDTPPTAWQRLSGTQRNPHVHLRHCYYEVELMMEAAVIGPSSCLGSSCDGET